MEFSDTAMADVFSEDEARAVARRGLSKSERSDGKSPTADMQTRCAPGKQHLKSPRNAALVTHATATRAKGRSRELIDDEDWQRGRIANVIYALEHPHPIFIAWRHHGDASVRDMARSGVVNLSMVEFMNRQEHTQRLAYRCGSLIVQPGQIRNPWETDQFWMTYEEWRNSSERKLWEEVRRVILGKEIEALRAMMAEVGE